MNPQQKLVLALGIPALLCCVCGGGAMTMGMSLYSTQVCAHLGQAEPITSRTGAPLTTCTLDLDTTLDLEDHDTFVFDVGGPKAQGRAIVKSVSDDDGNEVFQGVLFTIGAEEILVEGERPPTN